MFNTVYLSPHNKDPINPLPPYNFRLFLHTMIGNAITGMFSPCINLCLSHVGCYQGCSNQKLFFFIQNTPRFKYTVF